MLPARELLSERSEVEKCAGSNSLLYSRVQYIQFFKLCLNSYSFSAKEEKKAAHFSHHSRQHGGGRQAPTPLSKVYKCHPQTKVVLCIFCENFFHTNEVVSKHNLGCPLKFINNALIICQDHPNVALTSNLSCEILSSEAKQLIVQIKLTKKEPIKQEIISEIKLENHNNKKGLDDTVYEDYSEIESLKIENQLL